MGANAGKFYPRAPRYLLRPLDKNILRYKTSGARGDALAATVTDLSESGLSFDLTGEDPPREREILKVEFTVPGRRQIACFATVTRVEAHVETDGSTGKSVRVAIRFHDLPRAHRHSLRDGLADRIRDGETAPRPLGTPPLGLALRFAAACAALLSAFFLMMSGY